jgi:hypothetical protein
MVSGQVVKLGKPSSSAEVKNWWSCASFPVVCLHGLDGEIFNFYLFKNKYSAVSEYGK